MLAYTVRDKTCRFLQCELGMTLDTRRRILMLGLSNIGPCFYFTPFSVLTIDFPFFGIVRTPRLFLHKIHPHFQVA